MSKAKQGYSAIVTDFVHDPHVRPATDRRLALKRMPLPSSECTEHRLARLACRDYRELVYDLSHRRPKLLRRRKRELQGQEVVPDVYWIEFEPIPKECQLRNKPQLGYIIPTRHLPQEAPSVAGHRPSPDSFDGRCVLPIALRSANPQGPPRQRTLRPPRQPGPRPRRRPGSSTSVEAFRSWQAFQAMQTISAL